MYFLINLSGLEIHYLEQSAIHLSCDGLNNNFDALGLYILLIFCL